MNANKGSSMSYIDDIFTPKLFLPVQLTRDGMELLETTTGVNRTKDTLFIEIGDDRASTASSTTSLLDEHFPDLLDQAIEDNCEYISFTI